MPFSSDILSFFKSPKSKTKAKSPKSPSPKSPSPKFLSPLSSPPKSLKKRGRPKTRKCAPGVKEDEFKTRS